MNIERATILQASRLDYKSVPSGVWGTIGGLIILALWYYVTEATNAIPRHTLPSPVTVVEEFIRLYDLILDNLWVTLFEAIVGFTAAFILALSLGILLTLWPRWKDHLMPLIIGGNSIPRVAAAPIFIFYIGGGGQLSKYVIAAWIAFFPLLVTTVDGLSIQTHDREYMLRLFEATKWQEIRYVRFPNALPHIFDGMKIGVNVAMVGAIIGEFIAASEGIGYLLLQATENLQKATAIAIVLVIGVATVLVILGVFLLQDRVVFWREATMFGGEA